jgi:hypothetical protein
MKLSPATSCVRWLNGDWTNVSRTTSVGLIRELGWTVALFGWPFNHLTQFLATEFHWTHTPWEHQVYIHSYIATIHWQQIRYPLTLYTDQLDFTNISSDLQRYIAWQSECHYSTQVTVSRKTKRPAKLGGGAEHWIL